ncbi:hypothetical protein PFLL34_01295 [Pseudomonas fluorescens]|nr:hypothetical protein PFLL34_01295 [Pseudomonas fluorescens]
MVAQHGAQGHFGGGLATRLHLQEYRGFTEPAAQPYADHAEYAAEQEGEAPGVVEDFGGAEDLRQQGGGQRPQQVTEGQAGLQKTQGIATMVTRRVLGDEGPGAGHFAAHRCALQHAQRQQDQRGEIADLRIGRHDADQQAGQGHHENAQAEDALASQVVGKVRHQDAAQWTGEVAGDENAETLQQAQPLGHFRREEQLAEGQRKEHEDNEVVDFQGAAEGGQAQGFVVGAGKTLRPWGKGGSHVQARQTNKMACRL